MYDVAIVGGGPTGIVAANLCGQAGLRTIAFERESDVYDLPRAAGLHDDVQRLLDRAGLLEPILPATRAHVGAEFVDARGQRLTGIEFPGVKTLEGYPPVLAIAQPEIERTWRACLREQTSVEFHVLHEVCGVQASDEGVAVEVADLAGGGSREVRARWLIGADSANSFVRRTRGISWESLGYDCEWLVIDADCDPSVELPALCTQICDPDRPTTMVPMPGRQYRWEFQLRAGETRAEMEDPGRVWELLRPWLSPDHGQILRAVVYRFHATIASTFRQGPIFLAGDAAHQTPPFMGQGLCTGLRDVDNLVWKLAAVSGGRATEALLDSYDEERRPAALAMVQHSTNAGKLIDAYAEMTRTGRPPPADLVEYGYGGGKQLPDLEAGLLAPGDSPWIGRRMPQFAVVCDGRRGPLDAVVGRRWAVLASVDPRAVLREDVRRGWESLGAAFVQIDDQNVAGILGEDEAAVLRPDRIVYSLGPDKSLPEPFAASLVR